MSSLPGDGSVLKSRNRLMAAFMMVLAGLLLQSCGDENANTTTGAVSGSIRLMNQTPAVQSYLSGHAVIADQGSSVAFYPDGQLSPPVPSVAYTPVNNGQTVASYADLQPPLTAGSNLFHPEVSYLHFQSEPLFGDFIDLSDLPGGTSNPRYRLGSRKTDSEARLDCSVQSGQSAYCPLTECAVRANLNLHFVGVADDMDRLLPPVACAVVASVVEGSGVPSPQAYSGVYGGLLSDLTGNGLMIPMLVRGSGQTLSFAASCIARPAEHGSGFVVGDSGYSLFPLTAQTDNSEATLNCGDDLTLEINIPVLRQAGGIRGQFDISGQLENRSEVRISDFGNLFRAEPQPLAVGSLPDASTPWLLAAVPVGEHGLRAKTILDGHRHVIEFPHKEGTNGTLIVEDGLVSDLGATFVAQPHRQSGHLRLFDPAANTDLHLLQQQPFTSLTNTEATTYMSARGKHTQGTQCQNGGSGLGGRALNVVNGAFTDPSEGLFDYQLFLTGLSPVTGNLDGSDMRCTPWELDQLHLAIGLGSEIRQRTDIDLLDDFDLEAQPGASQAFSAPIQMCFGQLEVDIVANQSVGSLKNPLLSIRSDGGAIAATGDILSSTYDLDHSFVSAPPRNNEPAAGLVHLRATLPERLRYKLSPRVDLVSPDGITTQDVGLQDLFLPATGRLACGAVEKACLEVNNPSGEYMPLSISVAPQSSYCQQDGDLSLDIQIHSGTAEVGYARAEVFAQGEQTPLPGGTECAPCEANPELSLTLNDLAPGTYRLHATAYSQTGLCISELDHTFEVAAQPLSLTCPSLPAPLSLPAGQDSIAGDDPAIDSLLNASISGGCSELEYSLVDDRPDEFFPGTTNVTISTPASASTCEVPITITESSVLGLLYLVGETAQYFDMAQGQMTLSIPVNTFSWRSRTSADGSKALFLPAGTNNAGLIYDFQANSFQSLAGERGVWGRFDPASNNRLAVIATTPAAGNLLNYHLQLHGAGSVQSDVIVGADPMISEPRLAWRADSEEIVVAYTRRNQTSALTESSYDLILKRYPVNSSGFGAPFTAARTLEAPREELSDIAYLDQDRLMLVSAQRGVSQVELTSGQVTRINPVGFNRDAVVMNHNGSGVGFFVDQKPGLVKHPANDNPELIVGEPVQVAKPVLAVSQDLTHMAIAFPNRIDILALPGFELEYSIPAAGARGLEFRARAPE